MSKNKDDESKDEVKVHRGTEGGGPWPTELLVKHLTPLPASPVAQR